MVAPTLRIPLSLNMDDFSKGIQSAKSTTSEATQFIVKKFIDMNASVLATSGAAGSAALAFRSLLGTVTFVAGAIVAVEAAFKLMAYATELAKEKIEEFNAIAEKAGSAGVSNDFFQRFVKSGEKLKLTIDDATEALNRFAEKSQDALGGSQLQQRIDALVKAGNFTGNTGVASFGNSVDTEQSLRSIVSLVDQAMQKGERLAAIDLADRAFGSAVANNLRADSGYLDKMLATADQLNKNKIISDEQIGQAIDLKTRLEEAQKVLAEKWRPIQDDLAKLGMQYQESWVDIYQNIAVAVGYANQLYDALKSIPDVLAQAGNASFWDKLVQFTGAAGLNSRPSGLIMRGEPGFSTTDAGSPAFNALKAGLQNPAAVRRAMEQTTDVATSVRGDTSKNPVVATNQAADAYDRAQASIEKYTARLGAEAQAQGLGTQALEEFKAEAQLTTAALQAGLDPASQKVADRISDLAQDAGEAAQALEKARVATSISRGSQTALLSPEDVQIAQQLRGLYPNVAEALQSVEAAALRTNQAFSQVSSQISGELASGLTDIVSGSKSASQGFSDMAAAIIKDIERMIIQLTIVGPLMRSLQSGFGSGGNIFSSLFSGGGGFSSAVSAGSYAIPKAGINFADGGYTGPGGKYQPAGIVHKGEYVMDAESTKRLGVPFLNSLRGYADGGFVGQSVPDVPSSRSAGLSLTVVNNSSGAEVDQPRQKPDGSFEITIRDMVRGVINNDLSSGTGVARSFKAFSGASNFRGS